MGGIGVRSDDLDRREAVRELLHERRNMLVVAGLGSPTYDVFAAGDCDGNFYLWGAMGGASAMGLGLALAQPKRPVLVITGDGELLMGLGTLATVLVQRPENLSIVVLDNGQFGETGMQLSHTGMGIELHRIAAAVGFARAVELRTLAEIAEFRSDLLEVSGGPRFATVRIAPGNPARALAPRDGVYVKNRFRAHLGYSVK